MMLRGCLIMWSHFAVLLLLFLGAGRCLTPVKPLSEWEKGKARYFGGPKDHPLDPFKPVVRIGGCSYGELDPQHYPFYNIVAIHPDSPLLSGLEAHGCGACFEIQCVDRNSDRCVNGPQTNNIVVVNAGACSIGCGGTIVNMHIFAFDKIAAIKYGVVEIGIRQVECQPFGNLEINIKDYRVEEGGFLKITVKNIPGQGGLEKLELRGKPNSYANGGWLTFENKFGAAFELSKLPDPPFDLRLTTSIDGVSQQETISGVIYKRGLTGAIETSATFPGVDPFPRTSGQTSRLSLPTASAVQNPPGSDRPPPSSGITTSSSTNSTSGGNARPPKPNVPPEDLDQFVVLVEEDGR